MSRYFKIECEYENPFGNTTDGEAVVEVDEDDVVLSGTIENGENYPPGEMLKEEQLEEELTEAGFERLQERYLSR